MNFYTVASTIITPNTDTIEVFFDKMNDDAYKVLPFEDGYVWQGDYLKTGSPDTFIYYRSDYDNKKIKLILAARVAPSPELLAFYTTLTDQVGTGEPPVISDMPKELIELIEDAIKTASIKPN